MTQLRLVSNALKTLAGSQGSELEQFKAHLNRLGLLGTEFDLPTYIAALERVENRSVRTIHVPDLQSRYIESVVLTDGDMAQYDRSSSDSDIRVTVRESLSFRPWPDYELNVYHELMHHVCCHEDRHTLTNRQHTRQERQADRWSNWALLAGSEPDLFRDEGIETVT